jgi:hypothetical protein
VGSIPRKHNGQSRESNNVPSIADNNISWITLDSMVGNPVGETAF